MLRHAPTRLGATVIGTRARGVNHGLGLALAPVAQDNRRMARPVRRLWKVRTVVRRRHRTWMASMSLASLGWGSWWITVFLMRYAPAHAPSLAATSWFAGVFAGFGLLAAIWSIRARRTWLLFTTIPMLANGSLFLVPWLIETLRSR
jgi:hypothetical protein